MYSATPSIDLFVQLRGYPPLSYVPVVGPPRQLVRRVPGRKYLSVLYLGT